MEIDRFNAYSDALNVILQAEVGGSTRRKPNLPEGRQTVAGQADAALDDAFAQQREKGQS